MSWYDDALCQEIGCTEMFFSEGQGDHCRTAKAVCALCPVRVECLDAAMKEEYGQSLGLRAGIRGGTSPVYRARLAKARGEIGINKHRDYELNNDNEGSAA